jgi:small-conductance mechanosensitive channel
MTSQPMDYRDYLIRQHEQERVAQRFEALFSKSDEDHAAEQADRVAQQAYDTAEACAVDASEVEEALTEVLTQARDLHQQIGSGPVSDKDVRDALGNLRKQRAKLVARTASIKTVYEGAVKTIEDPAARVAALKNKYPALRR